MEAPQGKFLILNAPFYSAGAQNKSINEILGEVEGVDYDEDNKFRDTATQIQVLNNLTGGYKTYYYLNDGYIDDNNYKAGWCDADGILVEDELVSMEAFWFRSVPSKSVSQSRGAISTNSSESILCPVGFALRGCAYPMPIDLNSDTMLVKGIQGVDYDEDNDFRDTATQIQVPSDNGGYKTYYYLNDGYIDDDTYKAGWCDADGIYVNDVIPISQGFWTKGTSGSFELIFNSNIKN